MNEQEKKQLEIAKKTVEQKDCLGIACFGTTGLFEGVECPLRYQGCGGYADQAVDAAEAYIKEHSKISRKDLLERIEKLEEKVDRSGDVKCNGVSDAKALRKQLEADILSLVAGYEDKTGLKVDDIELKTGPFLHLDIFKREGEEQRNDITRKDHIVKVKVNL